MITTNTPSLSSPGRVSLQCITTLTILLGMSSVACPQQHPDASTKKEAKVASDTTTPAKKADMKGGGEEDVANAAGAEWLSHVSIGAPLPDDVVSAMREKRTADAYALLAKSKPDVAKQPYHVLLLGQLAGELGKHKECVKHLSRAAKKKIVLTDYAHVWAAQCAFDKKDWSAAAEHAAQVSPDALEHDAALFLLGEALYAGGTSSDKEKARAVYAAFLDSYDSRRGADLVRMRLAELEAARKKYDRAATLYNDVITYNPLSEHVPAAIAAVGKLKPKTSKKTQEAISATSDEQRIRKLRALFKRHRSEQAVTDGARYARIFSKGSELYCETNYLVGKSYTKLRDHDKSIPWYENVAKHCDASKFVIKSYYNMGRGQWNSGNRKPAKVAFEKLYKKFPSSSYADDAMLYHARILKEEGSDKAMRKLLAAQVKKYPKGDMAKDAHWLLVRDMIAAKKHADIIEYVDSVEDPHEHDLYSAGRLKYYKARALEAQKKSDEAKRIYREIAIEQPLGYYAMLSLNHLARIAGERKTLADVCQAADKKMCAFLTASADDAAATEPLSLPDGLSEDASFVRGATLLKLGLGDAAEDEFRALSGAWAKDDRSRWALAMLLDAAGAYALSHNIPRRQIADWVTGYPDDQTRQRWEIAYPAPFSSLVTSWAKKREIPPELVWAIMREESGFNPAIESWANARGLLQLMAGTAKTVAAKDDLKDLETSALFDANTNVRLGTAYMKELGDEFDNHPAMIIAGYNGGAGNVNRWVKARGDLPLDLFIEDIPYGQTRNYTKRVLTSFWTYHFLYGAGRTPGLSMEVPDGDAT